MENAVNCHGKSWKSSVGTLYDIAKCFCFDVPLSSGFLLKDLGPTEVSVHIVLSGLKIYISRQTVDPRSRIASMTK